MSAASGEGFDILGALQGNSGQNRAFFSAFPVVVACLLA